MSQDHDLRLRIDASAAKSGSAQFVAAINAVKKAVRDLERDTNGAFTALSKRRPETDVSGLKRATTEAQKLTSATTQSGAAADRASAQLRALAVQSATALRVSSDQASRLRDRLINIGDTDGLVRVSAGLAQLKASLASATTGLDVREARQAYADLASQLNQTARESERLRAAAITAARAEEEAARAAVQHAQSLDQLKREFNPLYSASKQYEATLERIALAERQGAISTQLAAAAREKARASLAGFGTSAVAAGRGMSQMGWQVQNAGYQIGDFFVQVASGQSATRALAQQLPQLLGGFGVFGAVAGAAVAALAALLPLLSSGESKARKFGDIMGEVSTSLQNYRDASENARGGTLNLAKEFGAGAESAQRFYMSLSQIEKLRLAQSMRDATTSLVGSLTPVTDLMEQWDKATLMPKILRPEALQLTADAAEKLQSQFGLSINQAHTLTEALSAARMAKGPTETAAAMQRVVDAILAASASGATLPPALLEAAKNAAELGMDSERMAAVLEPLHGVIGQATAQTDGWASAMSGVRVEINAILSALSSIGGGAISNAAKQAEVAALQAGKTVSQAAQARERASKELEWKARTSAAEARGILGLAEKGAIALEKFQFDEGQKLDAQLETLRESARKAARSGGGRGKTDRQKYTKDLADELKKAQALGEQYKILATSTLKSEEATKLYGEAMVLMGGKVDAATTAILRQIDAQILKNRDLAAAAKSPARAFLESVPTYAEGVNKIQSTALDSLQNSFVELFKTGKFGLQSFADSMINVLAEVLASQTVKAFLGLFDNFGGNGTGGGGGGWFGQLIGAIFGFSEGGYSDRASPHKHLVNMAAFASPSLPHYAEGTQNTSGGIPAMLHPNEAVIPLSRGRKIPVEMRGGEGAGGSYAPTLNYSGDINVKVDGSGTDMKNPEEMAKMATALAATIRQEVKDVLAREISYGGMLNPRGGRAA